MQDPTKWALLSRKLSIELIDHRELKLCLHIAFNSTFWSLWCSKFLCRVLKQKYEHQTNHKSLDLQSVLPAICAGTKLAQN